MARIEIRPFTDRRHYEAMVDYFLSASDEALAAMGVARHKLPMREDWLAQVLADHDRPKESRERFYLAWLVDGEQVGHSSLGKIRAGQDAYVHLHLWRPELRKSGVGTEFLRLSIDFYFERFRLQRLLCEPYANNPAPNRVLGKLGFRLVRRYRTVPGTINVEQDVNLYELTRVGPALL